MAAESMHLSSMYSPPVVSIIFSVSVIGSLVAAFVISRTSIGRASSQTVVIDAQNRSKIMIPTYGL